MSVVTAKAGATNASYTSMIPAAALPLDSWAGTGLAKHSSKNIKNRELGMNRFIVGSLIEASRE